MRVLFFRQPLATVPRTFPSYRGCTLFTTGVLRFSKGKSGRAATAQSLATVPQTFPSYRGCTLFAATAQSLATVPRTVSPLAYGPWS